MTITDHAVQRYIERHRPDLTPDQARRKLKRLVRRAKAWWAPGSRDLLDCEGVKFIIVRNAVITIH